VIGALIGAFQGYWVAYVKIPAFIVTLAGMLIFRGLTLVMLQGEAVGPFPNPVPEIKHRALSRTSSSMKGFISPPS
jgi:putative multiple sugar transport system permease protein